jgi:predicted dehydrogenase
MKDLGVALIGTGFMGMAHAFAYRSVGAMFPHVPKARLVVVADVTELGASRAAQQFGFEESTTDWRRAIHHPGVDVVSITTPNALHKEMALEAMAAGKHVLCEKPLAPTSVDALEMLRAADAAKIVTHVGFNYIQNPLLALARDMIAAGELGEITDFRGIHAEDYMADPEVPFGFRLAKQGGGALADIGSHIVGMARFLLGPISEVYAQLDTLVASRPIERGSKERRPVEVDDVARLLVRFERGCGGSIQANWAATGRKMQLAFELTGTKGSLVFNQERLNELLHYRTGGDPRTSGFVRIEAGPQHPPYGNICVAGGHQLGFNELKTIEVAKFFDAINGGPKNFPDFREGWAVQAVIDAALQSSRGKAWVSLQGQSNP